MAQLSTLGGCTRSIFCQAGLAGGSFEQLVFVSKSQTVRQRLARAGYVQRASAEPSASRHFGRVYLSYGHFAA